MLGGSSVLAQTEDSVMSHQWREARFEVEVGVESEVSVSPTLHKVRIRISLTPCAVGWGGGMG